jgi:hypothetical protein
MHSANFFRQLPNIPNTSAEPKEINLLTFGSVCFQNIDQGRLTIRSPRSQDRSDFMTPLPQAHDILMPHAASAGVVGHRKGK